MIPECDNLIMDVDGVIFDSNHIKEENIKKVASYFLDGPKLSEFVNYFISGNGIPRESKIARFFGSETKEYYQVLSAYNELNNNTLYSAALTEWASEFISNVSQNMKIWAISGGAEPEIKKLFNIHNLTRYFEGIHGGPTSKKDHLKRLNLSGPTCYIGDSKVDHESAGIANAQFIFMYRYTQFQGLANLL